MGVAACIVVHAMQGDLISEIHLGVVSTAAQDRGPRLSLGDAHVTPEKQ